MEGNLNPEIRLPKSLYLAMRRSLLEQRLAHLKLGEGLVLINKDKINFHRIAFNQR